MRKVKQNRRYQNIAVVQEDFFRIEAVKKNFEADFRRKVNWTEFLLILSTGYIMGKQIMDNEDKLTLEVQTDRV